MNRTRSSNLPPATLVDFVLRHVRVDTAPGSLQHCEDGSFFCDYRVLGDTNLIYVTRGRSDWKIDGHVYQLSRGDLLLAPRGVRHKGISVTQRLTLLSLHLIPTLPGGQDAFDLLRSSMVQNVQPESLLDQYLRMAMREYDRSDRRATQQALHHWASLITLELIRCNAAAGLTEARLFDPLVAAVLDALEMRIAIPTQLKDLAKISGYTPQHLNRLFQRTLGVTPLQHLSHLRMHRAAELLTSEQLSIAAAAERVGFEDAYYFSRQFKQHFGKSPSQYRDDVSSENPF